MINKKLELTRDQLGQEPANAPHPGMLSLAAAIMSSTVAAASSGEGEWSNNVPTGR